MTEAQQKVIKEIALKIKDTIPEFCGSITFHLTQKFNDVKIEVNETIKSKSKSK